ncbi:MAG: hypothetical protein UE295_02215 [Acutalibacteraceae bacterium]|nr:hypothetical protein [Acutalibacteraceae bacterium]
MKRILFILTAFLLAIGLSACTYNPPQGYTEEHHTYEELVEFAKSIDPDASVLNEFTDTTIEAWELQFREYPAVINGVECNVSSVGTLVCNDGFAQGAFYRQYFMIDTDYDYYVLKEIVSKVEPEWKLPENDVGSVYTWDNSISVYIEADKTEQLTNEEFEVVWQSISSIYSSYSNLPMRKTILFCLPAPEKTINRGKECVAKNAYLYINSFSENDKNKYLDRYKEAWKLLESDLPVYE